MSWQIVTHEVNPYAATRNTGRSYRQPGARSSCIHAPYASQDGRRGHRCYRAHNNHLGGLSFTGRIYVCFILMQPHRSPNACKFPYAGSNSRNAFAGSRFTAYHMGSQVQGHHASMLHMRGKRAAAVTDATEPTTTTWVIWTRCFTGRYMDAS